MNDIGNKTIDVRSISCFNHLNEIELDAFVEILQNVSFKKYQYAYMQGCSSDGFYLLAKGMVKTGHIHKDGKEVIQSFYHAPTIFGECAMIDNGIRQHYSQILSKESRVYFIFLQDYENLAVFFPAISKGLIKFLAGRIMKAEHRLDDIMSKDAKTRVLDFIKNSTRDFGRKVGFEIEVLNPLTQQDIASFTGTSRQTVAQVFFDLKKSNSVLFNRRSFLVKDLTLLY